MKRINILLIIIVMLFINLDFAKSQSKEWDVSDWAVPRISRSFVRIRCADSLNCMIWGEIDLGWGHYFEGTISGGKSWGRVYLDSTFQDSDKNYYYVTQIEAIEYPSTKLFIAVGDSGFVLKTKDRGKSWQKHNDDTSLAFRNIKMLDDEFGIVQTWAHADGKVGLKYTTDAGESWTWMNTPDEFDSAWFRDYQVLDRNHIVALIQRSGEDNKLLHIYGNWDSWELYPVSNSVWDMFFIDENNGWLYGGKRINDLNNSQFIVHTEDGGKSWETQWDSMFYGMGIKSLKFFNKDIGMAVGGYASYLTTYNGGKTWRLDTIIKPNGGFEPFTLGSLQMPSITNAYVIADGRYIYKYTRDWTIGVKDEEDAGSFVTLGQNSPNPFSGQTEISYTLDRYTHVKLNIYDMMGNIKIPLVDDYQVQGVHSVVFSPDGLPQGTYFYRLETDKGSVAKQMVLIK